MDILFDCDRPVPLEIRLGIADFGAFDCFESDHIEQHTSIIIDSVTILRVQADITGSQRGGRRNSVTEEGYLSPYKATRRSLVFQGGHISPLKAIAVLSYSLLLPRSSQASADSCIIFCDGGRKAHSSI
jgi:hypothetical protein